MKIPLNNAQNEAVQYVAGPLLVIAGAGSGKTRVITAKIAHLINHCQIDAHNIVAITFTNKAASEMLERVNKIVKNNRRGLNITTFHAFGLQILRQEAKYLDYKPNFTLLDNYDSSKILADIANINDKEQLKIVKQQISNYKNSFLNYNTVLNNATNTMEEELAIIYQRYQETLNMYQAVDFDDLIMLPIEIFNNHVHVLQKWQKKFAYLLVDEYQDTNYCQYLLINLLIKPSGMLTAVGDDDQSIYAWRGANSANLTNLQQHFPQLKVIKLEQNYRSTNTILQAANLVIQNNNKMFEKNLWSKFGLGEKIKVSCYRNEEAEAKEIASKIMLSHHRRQRKFADYAILYRNNHQARLLEQALRDYQLPYQISGGQSFFTKPEIKDILAYLRLLANEDDDSAFLRCITTPKRGIGQTTLDKLSSYAKSRNISLFAALFEEGFAHVCSTNQHEQLLNFGYFINNLQERMLRQEVKDTLSEIIVGINYETYLYEYETEKTAQKKFNNVLSLIEYLHKKSLHDNKNLLELLQLMTLLTILDNNNNEQDIDAIKLSTIHAAKGLEFPYVYLISCEDGILPHKEAINHEYIDEERRLFYVAITRAKEELYISYCKERKNSGELTLTTPSRFIAEMGDEHVIDEEILKKQKLSDSEIQNNLKLLQAMLES